ncbi:MAG: type transport system permease protein [Chloroflexota bacterium]|nr:type transport system permease protein [Chloroflexota bacterium]
MIATIARLTFRALTGRRRTLLVALLGGLPILIAVLVRVSGRTSNLDAVATVILDRLVISTLVPLVGLVFGTAALGSELEDGTAVYLLTKPIARWRIVAAKAAVAAGLAIAVTAPAAFATGAILGSGSGGMQAALGYTAGAAVAAILYVVIFMALSLVTGRALAIGLVYILVWEGVLAGLFEGTRTFSIRQYALGVADAISGGDGAALGERLAGPTALALAVAALVIALLIAVRRLQGYEIGEAD